MSGGVTGVSVVLGDLDGVWVLLMISVVYECYWVVYEC